ncbi:hypothetical protein [Prosthecobacter sp.]|uniref:hypothetical protein n=1 Tax=Prosthecobacter sp. TaxID=1965333 RepID=UPI002488791F|nr:hypothetical protein [Prosthecobacter sp.]MDI1311784.1 hypothetical protein [Prosthecobacter sp.]
MDGTSARTQQWAPFWKEEQPNGKPTLIKLVMAQAGGEESEQVFWIVPAQAVTQTMH